MNKELEANQIISHHRIISEIGAGGVGGVYKVFACRYGNGIH
jgi:hypothetical protein